MNKKLLVFGMLMASMCTATACSTEAGKVSRNISQEADSFNVCRKITVFDTRTEGVLYEFEGWCSIDRFSPKYLIVTSEVGKDKYKKDFIQLNGETCYTVVDISGAEVDKYHYEWNILPEYGIRITHND